MGLKYAFCSKHRKTTKLAIISILVICILVKPAISSCPVSDLTSTKTTMYTYSGFTSSSLDKIIAGPVSNNLYYFDAVSTPNQMIIRKVALDGTNICTNLSGNTPAIQIHVLSDNSGYYVITKLTSSAKVNVCKYLFSSKLTSSCQEGSTLEGYSYTQLLLSDTQIFFIAEDTGSPFTIHMYKLTFGNTTPDWASKILCPYVICVDPRGVAKLSSDGSSLLIFFNYGAPIYSFFITLDASTGSSIGTRYKSNYYCLFADGFATFGNYYVFVTQCNSVYTLVLYNMVSTAFTYKDFLNSPNIYSVIVEPVYGRMIVNGKRSNICYETKIYLQSIDSHPDLGTSTLVMSALSVGSFDVLTDVGATISAITAQAVTLPSYTNQSVTYQSSPSDSYTSDIQYQSTSQSYLDLAGNTYTELNPSLTCSSSGSTSISYSIASYNGASVPSWISIDSTGILKITNPDVNSATDYSFYINSQISGSSYLVQKLITIRVNKCSASNCQKCGSNYLTCAVCNSGYELYKGSCNDVDIETSQRLFTVSWSIIVVTSLLALLMTTIGTDTFSSVWLMINQLQMLLLLLLTQIYMPLNVIDFIVGFKFALISFDFVPFKKAKAGVSVEDLFGYNQANDMLSRLDLDNGSSVVNNFSLFSVFVQVGIAHILIFGLHKLMKKYEDRRKCRRFRNLTIFICSKLLLILTFRYYVRNILESYQYLLLSCISELYKFNTSSNASIASIVFGVIILVCCWIFLIFDICITYIAIKKSCEYKGVFKEFFSGLKNRKYSKFHSTFELIRKIIYVTLVIILSSSSSTATIILMSIFQLMYTIHCAVSRSFEEKKDCIIEIMNEIFLCFYINWLFIFNSRETWSITSSNAYIGFITANNILTFMVVLASTIRSVCRKIRHKCKYSVHVTKCTVTPVEEFKHEEFEPNKSNRLFVDKGCSVDQLKSIDTIDHHELK